MRVVNGGYRGVQATLDSIDMDNYSATVTISKVCMWVGRCGYMAYRGWLRSSQVRLIMLVLSSMTTLAQICRYCWFHWSEH